MIPKEIIKHIRRIEVKTNKIVNEIFAGQYLSVFKGRGIEFEEVREYIPGDDVRSIDWNVTARYAKLFVKKYAEERELTIMLLLDMSGSQLFGSKEKSKSEITAEIASIIAFSALKNNDKVGAIIFTNQPELYIPAKKSLKHVLRIIREILYYNPKNKTTNINSALQYFYRAQKKKSIVFLFSDFKDTGYEKSLKIVAKKHDLILLRITDPLETKLPELLPFYSEYEDIETGKTIGINFISKSLREKYLSEINTYRGYLDNISKKYNIDLIDIYTDKPYIETLLKFFYKREKRLRLGS
ncbi:MAG: DUF58 domain-containing protein [Endomicrobia bacterium]|nr:DUF58 domain-containing protein [Endomicrobiia bacterium]MDW8056318.1 DUF58 domain-containing protein [Elusimicrobiota bacterium]